MPNITDEQIDAIADAHRWDTAEGRRAMVRAALAVAGPSPDLARGWLRFEKLRRLNPRQSGDLYARNLAGEFFDDLVDALPQPSTQMPR